ncbi:MAG: hypothetical protein HKN85_10695 [Gammaproteobacteria bacterium]|nr:hypothetical protein [Gammaproteobacteria bacterium]
MIVNRNMHHILRKIRRKQPAYEEALNGANILSPVICCTLINLYTETQNLETRELITEFMEQAGYPWLRKLVMRDATPDFIAVNGLGL